ADIHRPSQRQWHLFEHGLIEPLTLALAPKPWMADVLFLDPGPVRVAPEAPIVVSTFAHELEKLAVRYFVGVDREGRHLNRMNLKLVVPAKRFASLRNPERHSPSRNVDHPRKDRWAGLGGRQGAIAVRR